MPSKILPVIALGLFAASSVNLLGQDKQDPFADDDRRKRTLLEIQILEDNERETFFYELESFRLHSPINQLVQLIVDGKGSFKDAEISEEQTHSIRKIHTNYLRKYREVLGDKVVGNRLDLAMANLNWESLSRDERRKVDEFSDKFKDEVIEVFLPQQLKGFANTGLISGIPKIVTDSPISEILDVSDEQKRKIQIESNKLAEEIEEFAHKTRLKAAQIAMKNLTEEQKEQLFDIYGKQKVERQFSKTPIGILFRQLSFTENPPKGSMNLPKGKHVDSTDVTEAMKEK